MSNLPNIGSQNKLIIYSFFYVSTSIYLFIYLFIYCRLDGFGESDQAMYSEQFIKAYEDGDVELLNSTKSSPTVTHLDIEVKQLSYFYAI